MLVVLDRIEKIDDTLSGLQGFVLTTRLHESLKRGRWTFDEVVDARCDTLCYLGGVNLQLDTQQFFPLFGHFQEKGLIIDSGIGLGIIGSQELFICSQSLLAMTCIVENHSFVAQHHCIIVLIALHIKIGSGQASHRLLHHIHPRNGLLEFATIQIAVDDIAGNEETRLLEIAVVWMCLRQSLGIFAGFVLVACGFLDITQFQHRITNRRQKACSPHLTTNRRIVAGYLIALSGGSDSIFEIRDILGHRI